MECQNFMFLTVAHNDRMYGNDDGTILRRHSMPSSPFRLSLSSNDIRNPLHDDILRRVRSFKTTSKGVINRGDILRKRNSLISSGCQVTDFDIGPGLLNRVRIPSTTSQGSEPGLSLTSSGAPSCYRIMVLGSSGVGKSALIKQFMSSENSVGIDDSNVLDNTISVILDDEESLLEFCNYPDDQYPEEDINVDAYVVVFSITDQSTYDYAVHLMKYLRNVIGTDRSILVVANKTDLVRNRTVERKAMIDSLGGPVKVNNFLTALNLKPICNKNLKLMEERAGEVVKALSLESSQQAAMDAFKEEMADIACQESQEALDNMEDTIEDLGVCPLPDASPSLKLLLQARPTVDDDSDWTDCEDNDNNIGTDTAVIDDSNVSVNTDFQSTPVTGNCTLKSAIHHRRSSVRRSVGTTHRINLASKFPCQTRSGMSCAVDTAWHKRGFDSLTSHTFFMSKAKYGKKVVKTIVSHRTCGTCNWWRRHRPGQTVKKHHCVRNHSGSARSMESTSGVQGVKELIQEGTPVEYLEGDGDNTIIARLKSNLNLNMKKRFDRNHVVKNVGKSLYALHNEKGVKLSKNVIIHIEKCLKYVFAKNQGNVDSMQDNLKALIPHQFGDHSMCKGHFCGYKRKPGEVYIHRSLPYKTALKDLNLRVRLQKIFDPLISNAEHYIDLGSSQQCEHANREVTLRAPKSHHYGNSKSLDYRVHATAAFINDGRHYIPKAHSSVGLSPGIHTVRYADMCMKRRAQQQEKSQLPSSKRRRLVLKQERAINQGALEALEGATYQSGIGHLDDVDVEKLPDAIPRGNFKPITLQSGEPTFITIDLETTDLIRGGLMPHITQIAAMEVESAQTFETYVRPGLPITSEAQRVTGIVMNNSGSMKVNCQSVEPVSIISAIKKLCKWLEKFSNVILVAHNGRRFDYPVLISSLICTNTTDSFFKCVLGLIDSLSVCRKLFPNQSHKQEDLVKSLLDISYNAHNAISDVESLVQLIKFTKLSPTELLAYSFTPNAVYNSLLFNREKAQNLNSLDSLISRGVCKRPTAENIAGSGLRLSHLKTIYQRCGEDGLRDIFTANNNEGVPRVTKVKKILDEVIPKMAEYFKP